MQSRGGDLIIEPRFTRFSSIDVILGRRASLELGISPRNFRIPGSALRAARTLGGGLDAETCVPISPVAFAICSASALTSEATKAKPRPVSPARAASMVALGGRIFAVASFILMNS